MPQTRVCNKMKNPIIIFIILIYTSIACSNRIIIKSWDGNKSFREGDKVIFVLKGEIDTLPSCKDSKNAIDSIKDLNFKIIYNIEKSYCSLTTIKNYKYDTLTRQEMRIVEKQNKDYRKKYYRTTIAGDSAWLYVFKVPEFSTPEIVYYDSIDLIIEKSLLTECDSYFKRRIFPPEFGKQKLYRWKITNENRRIRGKG